MQENRDGTFEGIQEFSEFFEEMTNPNKDFSKVKAFHFGTRGELEKVKSKKNFHARIEALESDMKNLKKKKSGFIIEPTHEEIKKYTLKGPLERNMFKIMCGLI